MSAANDNSSSSTDTDAVAQLVLDALAAAGDSGLGDLGVWASEQKPALPLDDTLVGACKRLERVDVATGEWVSRPRLTPTAEGKRALDFGTPEGQLLAAVLASPGGKASRDDVHKDGFVKGLSADDVKIGFSQAMRMKMIVLDKATQAVSAGPDGKAGVDPVRDQLRKLASLSDADIKALKSRKLVISSTVTIWCNVKKGKGFVKKLSDLAQLMTDLTAEDLASGAWEKAKFKPTNFNALGVSPMGGHLHPLMKVRTEFREIFLEMGFEEMPTNNFVESSFWNFDALFQPQQHPARDAHDTFFLTEPAKANLESIKDYVERVQTMHETGGQGSIGWRYDWSLEESKKNILRTHTTAVSSRMLYKLANQEGGFKPKKYFSIDRVFRNEAVDATHLAEFHQIEGLVADYDLTLGNLMGVIQAFFHRLGMKSIRFKPAYNPYTEPSMEVFAYHEGLGKWVEVGNSGIFRPEMLLPMGLPENVRVIAWGLSLERPTMIKYGINNIRELVGHKISLNFVEKNSICRLDETD